MTNELNMLNTYLNNQVVIEEIPASAGMTSLCEGGTTEAI